MTKDIGSPSDRGAFLSRVLSFVARAEMRYLQEKGDGYSPVFFDTRLLSVFSKGGSTFNPSSPEIPSRRDLTEVVITLKLLGLLGEDFKGAPVPSLVLEDGGELVG